jgi:hypothetical protein
MTRPTDKTPTEPTVTPASKTLIALITLMERQFHEAIDRVLRDEREERGLPESARFDPQAGGWVVVSD